MSTAARPQAWNNRPMTRRSVTPRSGLVRTVLLVLVAGVVGQLVAKRMTRGDEDSDDVRLAAIVGGKELKSRATALRSASALAVMGGVEIDLRDASLDPGGATLDVTAIMGGVEVRLPVGWVVDVESRGGLGGVDTRLTEAADLPDGAPTLRVTTNTWLGGVEISE
jgi:predicted membrane protein